MKKAALLLVVVALLAALALLIVQLSSSPTRVDTPSASKPSTTTAQPDLSALDTANASAAERERIALATPTPSVDRTSNVTANLDDRLALQCVDKLTGLPVGKADVFHLRAPPTLQLEWLELQHRLGEVVRVVESTGTRMQADDEGRVGLPWPDGRVFVFARTDTLAGLIQIDRTTQPPVTLEMVMDATLTVQVVDGAGTPIAGVPVALRARNAMRFYDVTEAVTEGEDGFALLPHAGLAAAANDFGRVVVAIAAVLEPQVEVELNVAALPRAPIQLVMPPTGEAEVWVKRRDGSPWTEAVEVGLLSISSRGADPRRSLPFHRDTARRTRTIGGRALFTHVAVGGTLEASAARPGFSTERRVEAPGPRQAGERATIVLTLDADPSMPTIEGRAVDEHAMPLASTELLLRRVTGDSAPANGWTTKVRTDAAGVFQIEIVWEHFDEGRLGFILARTAGELVQGDCARVELPVGLTPGVHPVGDVVIATGPLLVGGRVIDESNEPVRRAEVTLLAQRNGHWTPASFAKAITDESGRFEIHGCVDADRVRVMVRSAAFGTNAVDAELGTSGVRVVLSKAGAIRGSMIVTGLVQMSDLYVVCTASGSDAQEGIWRWPATSRPDGSFEVTDLGPGMYRVRVTTRGGDEPALDVDDVRVASGETTLDPRLQAIDLTDRVFACELSVLGPDGRPVGEFNVLSKPSGSEKDVKGRYNWSQSGKLRLVSIHDALDVTIDAEGMRRVHIGELRGHREVRMKAGIPVTVVLRGGGKPPESPFFLQPILVAQEDEELDCGWDSAPFDATGRTIVVAPTSGTYHVNVGVGRGRLFRGTVWVDIDQPQDVVIKDQPGEQTIEIELDAAKLAEALKAYAD